jgi:hypothetical protein
MKQCGLVQFGAKDRGSMFLQNVGTHLQVHKKFKPRKRPCISLPWEPKSKNQPYLS